MEMLVQVNGKTVATITVPTDASSEQMEREAVYAAWKAGVFASTTVARAVVVPGRLVNLLGGEQVW